jgi:hypothetical protein
MGTIESRFWRSQGKAWQNVKLHSQIRFQGRAWGNLNVNSRYYYRRHAMIPTKKKGSEFILLSFLVLLSLLEIVILQIVCTFVGTYPGRKNVD